MNKARKNYRGEDPTAMAALGLHPARHNTAAPASEPTPVGGVTMAPAARMQARSFGLHPYQVAAMEREAAKRIFHSGHQFQFMSHQVLTADNGGITTITHVM